MAKKYWKFGDKWAGVTSKGKRFVTDTRKQAMSKAGVKSRSNKSKGGGRKTGKKKGNKNRKRKFTIPIAPTIGLFAGLASPSGISVIDHAQRGEWDAIPRRLSRNYLGYAVEDGTWALGELKQGLLPLILGVLIHKFVGGSPLNLNRALGRAGVPILRL